MDSPLALYRRYRPETFSQVIGQDHVTDPLRNALANDRVNHAYLFSGPRGCGKTTSARILARTLNCAQAPTAEPCGVCDSCVDLATGGRGSIDVIEIDAASHGGVDDARDLREKAYFAPVRDRYKIYIIDEAHMVTNQGFNALLKLVEEPPPHLRFIFATTEPEKVIPTIRSRTHHYPFRLIPPRMLSEYVSELCGREGVAIEPAAVPLVVRAGAGSARDTLSVLDQLIGGSGPDGVTHALAVALLGFTPDALLDEIVDAFAASDGNGVFRVVDKVIESGQDPRRFAEDLLRRLRDLVVVAAVPDAPFTGLIDCSQDQGERLVAQASRFGKADLSRAADLLASGLMDMKGAVSPRLLLELICARVLLPAADHSSDGVQARLDRVEKRQTMGGGMPMAAAPAAVPAPAVAAPVQQAPAPAPAPVAAPVVQQTPVAPAPVAQAPAPPVTQAPGQQAPVQQAPVQQVPAPTQQAAEPEGWGRPRAAAPAPAAAQAQETAASAPSVSLTLSDVRRLWPAVVDATKSRRRLAWMLLTANAQVSSVDGNTVTVGFNNAGARESFVKGGNDEILRQCAIDVAGVEWKIECVVDNGATPSGSAAASHTVVQQAVAPVVQQQAPAPVQQAPVQQVPVQQQAPQVTPPAVPQAAAPAPAQAATQDWAPPFNDVPPPDWDAAPPPEDPYDSGPPPGYGQPTAAAPQAAPQSAPQQAAQQAAQQGGRGALERAREAIQQTRTGDMPAQTEDASALADAAVSPDDVKVDESGMDSTELLKRTLGARVIDEIPHS